MTKELESVFPERLWAGTDHSLDIAKMAYSRLMAGMFDTKSSASSSGEQKAPYNYSLQGNIGVIDIKGPLVNEDDAYLRYYGVTSYADIRRALIYGANDTEAKALVLHIDSGGGSVSGVSDTGRLISRIDAVKSVTAFTDGTMASAAYWLGCSASSVYTSATSIMGSIGVIATHKEYSAAFKAMGIGVTVIRAGEYKALANSAEPLTDIAKAQLQDQLNSAYGVFIGHVAEARGTTVNLADQNMGQGREFFGDKAVSAGLADGVETFDSLMSRISSKLLDSGSQTLNNNGSYQRGLNMKTALTEQGLAAIAAGATGATVAALAATPAAALVEVEAAKTVVETEPAKVTETPLTHIQAAAAPAPAPASVDASVVTYLQGQLAEANASLVDARVASTEANKELTAMKATHQALVKIAAASVSNMKVALNLTAVDMSAMSAESVLTEHASASALFEKQFKAGGVAAVSAAASEADKQKELPPDWAARVASVRMQPQK